jgi:hypothetical protein
MCILTFNDQRNNYPIQSLLHLYVMKHQNVNISTKTLLGNKKYCQMVYKFLNDNIKNLFNYNQKNW